MGNATEVFGYDIDIHGARVVVSGLPICNACLSGEEVNAQIRLLKADLDAVARRMKREIRMQKEMPVFDGYGLA